jgi:hypothetical protein
MKIHQLSTFIENRPGQLSGPCRLLARAGVDIRTLSLAETKEYGILRLVVDDWQRGQAALEAGGCVVRVSEVVGIEVPDRPGGLSGVLEVLDRAGINIEYMYAFTWGRAGKAVMIFRFDRPDPAIEALQAAGVNVVGSADVVAGLGQSGRGA